MKRDERPWRTIKIALPDDVACALLRAMELAKISGEATNEIEAIEALAGEYEASKAPAAFEQARKTPLERYEALCMAGFRCVGCGTSSHLECHHARPLSAGGEDSVRNLVPLCHACHETVTNGRWPWKRALPALLRLKAERKEEVERLGYARRIDRRADLERAVRELASPESA